MNDADRMNPQHPHPAPARQPEQKEPAVAAEATGTPEAVKEAELSKTAAKEMAVKKKAAKKNLTDVRGRGVDWVRASDLVAQGTGALSRRGIDFTERTNRRTRTGIVKGARWVGARARRLPPLSAFGRRGATQDGPARSGVGMR